MESVGLFQMPMIGSRFGFICWAIARLCRGGRKSVTDAEVYRDRSPFCLSFNHGFVSTNKAAFIGIAIELANR
jgi:hypothetical protein